MSEVPEQIKLSVPSDPQSWICICGNQPENSGFFPCLLSGDEVEPDKDGPWDGVHYRCFGCGRIIDQESRLVVGQVPLS